MAARTVGEVAMGVFAGLQRAYAAHRIATYPVGANKVPAVRGYAKVGAPASAQFAIKFAEAEAGGFCAGRRNRLTIVDIDSTDDKLVDECRARFGDTPLQVITPSGGRHLYYRNSGEPRGIRSLPNVDILGDGNVVAAGSIVRKGRYLIERGSLDDLDRLPPLRATQAARAPVEKVQEGERNSQLYRRLRTMVAHCDDFESLLDLARTWAADSLARPLADSEIVKTAASVWRFRGGRRPFMQHVVEGPKFAALVADVEAWALCAYLMAENGPDAEFMIADGLAEARGWSTRFVPRARRILVQMDIVECVRPPRKGTPGLYRWRPPS